MAKQPLRDNASINACKYCGNGYREFDEECDDRNSVSGDGCFNCKVEAGWNIQEKSVGVPHILIAVLAGDGCGNGIVTGAEQCDDGNKRSGDGCAPNCLIEKGWLCPMGGVCSYCGNGKIEGTETCDDLNRISGDGCSSSCMLESGFTVSTTTIGGISLRPARLCGNGIREIGESCDDGNSVSGDGCSSTCTVESGNSCTSATPSVCQRCGDGKVTGSETCDDAAGSNNDGCSTGCSLEPGYTCSSTVPNVCQLCGNGAIEGTEACDDGNLRSGDGCSSACALETGFSCTNSTGYSYDLGREVRFTQCCGNGMIEPRSLNGYYISYNQEYCDDGNLISGDGCASNCTLETGFSCSGAPSTCSLCGNGIREVGEQCDDGNNILYDGCTQCSIDYQFVCSTSSPNICQHCGDGRIQGSEVCDDGNQNSNDGCSSTCATIEPGYICSPAIPNVCQQCGNGVIEGNEACDDGDLKSNDGCSSLCVLESGYSCNTFPVSSPRNGQRSRCCGNGVVDSSESCDDRNLSPGDGCSSTCTVESGYICSGAPSTCSLCGNGIREVGEQCDDGNKIPSDGCSSTCTIESQFACSTSSPNICQRCGDGRIQGSEVCDDGNQNSNDGCSSTCATIEPGYTCSPAIPNVCQQCGNGIIEGTEACDDGNLRSSDGCSSACLLESGYACTRIGQQTSCCGNRVINTGEYCDDGNLVNGDGCSSTCTVEPSYSCTNGLVCQLCGNGVAEGTESCDDGNLLSLDGCSPSCTVEQARCPATLLSGSTALNTDGSVLALFATDTLSQYTIMMLKRTSPSLSYRFSSAFISSRYSFGDTKLSIAGDGTAGTIGQFQSLYDPFNVNNIIFSYNPSTSLWSLRPLPGVNYCRTLTISSSGLDASGICDPPPGFAGSLILAYFTRSSGSWALSYTTSASSPSYSLDSSAFSRDGRTIVTGDRSAITSTGSTKVLRYLSPSSWTEQASMLVGSGGVGSNNPSRNPVSLSSDGIVLAVGAPSDSSLLYSQAGAAWILARNTTTGKWVQQGPKLVGTGLATSSASPVRQGTCIALSADGSTLASGGPGDASGQGAVWIFTRTPQATSYAQQGSKLTGTTSTTSSAFGSAVAISADGNTVAVGGPTDNNNAGAVWVFARNPATQTWSQQGPKLVGSGSLGFNDQQGYSLSLSADGNVLAVGAPLGVDGGSVWIFMRNPATQTWSQLGSRLQGAGALGSAQQGFSVSLSANASVLAVGGPADPHPTDVPGTGSAWMFARNAGGAYIQVGAKITRSMPSSGQAFGRSVSLSADASVLAVSGPGSPTMSYMYVLDAGSWKPQGSGIPPPAANQNFYNSPVLSLSGDGKRLAHGGVSDLASGGNHLVVDAPDLFV